MPKTISLALMLLTGFHLAPSAFCADSVASQISAMPTGTRIELRLKNKQKLKGRIGPVSNSTFTLADRQSGEHQIAFDEVASVRQVAAKSHVKRNVLIGVAIGVAALGITAGILLRCGPLGCGFHPGI